jgi:hypothetical protein
MLPHLGYRAQGFFDRDQILRLSGAGHGSAGKPFKVLHRLKPVLQILA